NLEIATATEQVTDQPEVVTTPEELEGYITVKVLLKEIISPDRIQYRDNLSYFNILIDNSIRKWICRLHLNSTNWTV
ncbi:MAG: endonuclease, partial [Cohnella sp.]|nr:endonuclease [Cohnella sp.]